jgi:hypothetical protein
MDVLNREFRLFLQCAQQSGLRYLLIGGYAVNYYGYVRNTDDLDIWLAPTNENKEAFKETLLCMQYSQSEVDGLNEEDFTGYFVGVIGSASDRIDVLTIVHHALSYEEAEKEKQVFEIEPGLFVNIVPYSFLREMKLRSTRPKDLFDIARLEELRNGK